MLHGSWHNRTNNKKTKKHKHCCSSAYRRRSKAKAHRPQQRPFIQANVYTNSSSIVEQPLMHPLTYRHDRATHPPFFSVLLTFQSCTGRRPRQPFIPVHKSQRSGLQGHVARTNTHTHHASPPINRYCQLPPSPRPRTECLCLPPPAKTMVALPPHEEHFAFLPLFSLCYS